MTNQRFQLGNHLASVSAEVDENGALISYEEYHPYGTAAWRAEDSTITTSFKRYRYTGMERDDETGLALHGVRFYAPWLGRWCSSDPIGLGGGANRYRYSSNNPVTRVDRNGLEDTEEFRQVTSFVLQDMRNRNGGFATKNLTLDVTTPDGQTITWVADAGSIRVDPKTGRRTLELVEAKVTDGNGAVGAGAKFEPNQPSAIDAIAGGSRPTLRPGDGKVGELGGNIDFDDVEVRYVDEVNLPDYQAGRVGPLSQGDILDYGNARTLDAQRQRNWRQTQLDARGRTDGPIRRHPDGPVIEETRTTSYPDGSHSVETTVKPRTTSTPDVPGRVKGGGPLGKAVNVGIGLYVTYQTGSVLHGLNTANPLATTTEAGVTGNYAAMGPGLVQDGFDMTPVALPYYAIWYMGPEAHPESVEALQMAVQLSPHSQQAAAEGRNALCALCHH